MTGTAKWGEIVVSPNGVWKVLRRHGLNTRAKRLGLIAGYAAPTSRRATQPQNSTSTSERPGQLAGIDCFYVGRLKKTNGALWQLTAIDVASSFAWAELVVCPTHNPSADQTSKLARRVAADLKAPAGDSSGSSPTTATNSAASSFGETAARLGATHSRIHAGRPQTNGNVEALHKTILDESWRPAFARYIHPRYTGLKATSTPT